MLSLGIWGFCCPLPAWPPFFKKPLYGLLEISPENGLGLKGGKFNQSATF